MGIKNDLMKENSRLREENASLKKENEILREMYSSLLNESLKAKAQASST